MFCNALPPAKTAASGIRDVSKRLGRVGVCNDFEDLLGRG
jgi:hypothetical protein